jgi:hypothetical protein
VAVVIVERNVSKVAVRDQDALGRVASDHPSLDVHGDRCCADSDEIGIDAHDVSDEYRFAERHRVYGDSSCSSTRNRGRENSSCDVHLSEQPSAENIPVLVGIRRHGERPDGQGAARLAFGAILISFLSRSAHGGFTRLSLIGL